MSTDEIIWSEIAEWNKLATKISEENIVKECNSCRSERLGLSDGLVISGVPPNVDENLFDVVRAITNALNYNVVPTDFSYLARLPNLKDQKAPRILARLYSEDTRNGILLAYTIKGSVHLCDIGYNSTTKIFIKEILTEKNKMLYKKALNARERGDIHNTFTIDGLVYVSFTKDIAPICVVTVRQLTALLSDWSSVVQKIKNGEE